MKECSFSLTRYFGVFAHVQASTLGDGESYTLKTFFQDHSLGQKELDGRQFAKMAKDTKLIDKVCTHLQPCLLD